MSEEDKFRIIEFITDTNYVRGRGKVESVDFDNNIVNIKLQYGGTKYKFRYDETTRTVYFRNRRRRIDTI